MEPPDENFEITTLESLEEAIERVQGELEQLNQSFNGLLGEVNKIEKSLNASPGTSWEALLNIWFFIISILLAAILYRLW